MKSSALAPPALEWREVTLDLGAFAVRDVSLRLEEGAWMGIVGPTGAGKTILLEIAAGFRRPTLGRVLRRGEDMTTAPPEHRRVAYVPQDDLLFPHLDVRENLLFGATRSRRAAVSPRLTAIATQLGVAHLLKRRVQAISGGEAQRVSLGRALLADVDLLLLDECTSALDAETADRVVAVLERERVGRGLSIVQISHDLEEIRRNADVIHEMREGKLVPSALRRDRDEHSIRIDFATRRTHRLSR